MLTASGRRTIAVRVDQSRGDLRPPLAGRPGDARVPQRRVRAAGPPTSTATPKTTRLRLVAPARRCDAIGGLGAPTRRAASARRGRSDRCSSCSRVSARPTPCGCAHAPDSRHTHSPTGCRCSVIVTSALIAFALREPQRLPTPLPKSAHAATRANGEIGSPATTGHRSRNHATPGPGSRPVAAHEPHVVRVPVADVARRRTGTRTRRPLSGGGGASTAAMHRAARVDVVGAQAQHRRARDLAFVARRAARLRATAPSCPGRIVRTRDRERRERHRPQQLDGQPRDERRPGPGSCCSHTSRTTRSARRRASRSGPTVRGVSGVGTYAVAVAFEERAVLLDRIVGHGRGIVAVASVVDDAMPRLRTVARRAGRRHARRDGSR